MKPTFKNEDMDKGILLFTLIIVGIISTLVITGGEEPNWAGYWILIIFALIISPWFIGKNNSDL